MLYAGFDIGGTSIKMGILDSETGKIIHADRRETGKIAPQGAVDAICDMLYHSPCTARSVGAVSAGRVNPETGVVTAGNLNWWNVPLGEMLKERIGMPVAMDNDVQGALYAEWKEGVCQNANNVVYIALGTGIGGAFLINGQFYRGFQNEGGEIGHMITHADGEECACGGRGCFERYASASALARMAGAPNARFVFDAAREGDGRMQAFIRRYSHELCIGIAGIWAMFRPDMIVLGGGVSGAGDDLLIPVTQELSTNSPSIPRGATPIIRLAGLGNQAGLYGAALLARDRLA